MGGYSYFNCDFHESHREAQADGDILFRDTIDQVSVTSDGEEFMEPVCEVITTLHGDTIVSWHLNGYRLNEKVLLIIEDRKKEQARQYAAERLLTKTVVADAA